MNFNKKYIYLFVIVFGLIVVFSCLQNTREGFNNYIATGNKNDSDDDKYNSSYVAPAGNTVLYNMDEQGQATQVQAKQGQAKQGQAKQGQAKQQKKYKQKNWSRNDGPLGIPRSQIPEGDEDLYILKTEVIPPVCPACPNVTACPYNNNNKAPPPCPPCARCPEPAFECKKVPNYNSNNSEYLPRPVLADFSQFGM